MIVSYNLLQAYFSKKLPKPDALAEALTFHAFEIEGIEKKNNDSVIDVKVLPNRAHDCLSHHGVAREVSAILNIPLEKLPKAKYPKANKYTKKVTVEVKDSRAIRYQTLVIENVKVGPSPMWLRAHLENLGQRSVSNVVDATNYVMFLLGQPLHAFDYDKLKNAKIVVRPAKVGEKMTTLDGKDLVLDPDVMVIADASGVLGIAGVKGGTTAEIDEKTTNLVLEAANFDAESIRRTSQRLGIKTDASKRFESGLTPTITEDALIMVAHLILDIAKTEESHVGAPLDKYPMKQKKVNVSVTLHDICHILGAEFSEREVESVWKRLGFSFTKKGKGKETLYSVTVPDARLDLRLREDLVEEVGRLAGYHKLVPKMPIETITVPSLNNEWHARDVVREVMLSAGFSDVYTYGFNNSGEIEVANPIAADKKFLRNNLMSGLKAAVNENLKYESEVRIFEFGHVFGKDSGKIREESSFAAIVGFQKRKEVMLRADFYVLKGVLETVFSILGIKNVHYEEAGGELIASVHAGSDLLGTRSLQGFELDFAKMVTLADAEVVYAVPSRFPSIIRDVSLFVPMNTKAGDVEAVIRGAMGEIVRSLLLIDVFEKPEENKKSLAFRMVLQSFDKTLSDDEANVVGAKVIAALESANPEHQVRK